MSGWHHQSVDNHNPYAFPAYADTAALFAATTWADRTGAVRAFTVEDESKWARVLSPESVWELIDHTAVGTSAAWLIRVGAGAAGTIVDRGPWDPAIPYVANDLVGYGAIIYIALRSNTGAQPDTSPLDWKDFINPAPDATTTTNGVIRLAGDLGGTAASPSVLKVHGVPVAATVPTTGEAWVWDGTQMVPTTVVTGAAPVPWL